MLLGAALGAAAQPQLADYLAMGPSPWLPASMQHSPTWRADLIVAADGSGTHRTVQAAIDAVPARADSPRRVYIHLKPGIYRESVCVADKAPVTLFGSHANAAAVVIVMGHYNALAKRASMAIAHSCLPELAAASYGTPGSASMVIASDDVQLAHLTVANDAMDAVRDGVGYPAGAGESGGAQAVALVTQGDRIQLHQMRLLGHQDTFMARRAAGAPARVYVHASLIAGDVDFIFGNATLVLDDCTVLSRAGRRTPGNGGHVLAPSTPASAALGFLVTRSRLLAEPGVRDGSISLGRAWDEGVARDEWSAGKSPNGQVVVRDSVLGSHISQVTPWAASTSRRPFSATGEPANRFAEFGNLVLAGGDGAREVLAANDGWAAAEGGTTGGAAALLDDVFEVRSRAQLVAALKPFARPRIVRVFGRIDLSSDDSGRSLGAEDFRDAAFDFAAYERAFEPATWGKKPPSGALEDARRRSAQRQAAQVVMRVPSHSTLLGGDAQAALINGTLMVERVENVIVRGLQFENAFDHFPAWDPNDNAQGEWNSEYDNLTLRYARRVWIDHNSFSDGARPDHTARTALGRIIQHHDGLLDITQQSDLITVSWNHFHDHDKTSLVGSSDVNRGDDGRLRVTFHHNLWQQTMARTPRVRWGQVHLYNNLFIGEDREPYRFEYSIGVGVGSRIFSQQNAWETAPSIASRALAKLWRGTMFFDRGSLHNGRAVDLLAELRAASPGTALSADVGWAPTHHLAIDAASDVAARVRAGAGANHFGGVAPSERK